jgi:hypothetical protein
MPSRINVLPSDPRPSDALVPVGVGEQRNRTPVSNPSIRSALESRLGTALDVVDKAAHLLLQTRTKVLNDELEGVFRRWYPQFRAQAA